MTEVITAPGSLDDIRVRPPAPRRLRVAGVRPGAAPRTVPVARTSRPFGGRPRVRALWELAAAGVVGVAVSRQVALPLEVALAAVLGWTAALGAAGHYRRSPLGDARPAALVRVVRTGTLALLVAVASTPLLTGTVSPAAPSVLATALVLASTSLALGVRRLRARVVLAGHPRDIRDALAELRAVDRDDVVAVCVTRRSPTSFAELPTYLGLAQAAPAIVDNGADALIVLPGRHTPSVALRRLQWDVARVGSEIYLGTGLLDVEPQRARVVSSAGLDLLHVAPTPLNSPRRWVKDAAERSAALLGLALCLPLLAVLCVMIRRESPGPAVFRQVRIGRDGAPFTMIKLRTMSADAEEERLGLTVVNETDGVLFKIRLDPRITPLGQRLRRYSLDELPQLWNVVRGDMSLVGPRPALPGEVDRYDLDPRRRLAVKPGMTGLWQVSGRSDLSWSESVRLDLRYVDNWSLRLDLAIMVRTLRAVVGHRGAY